MSITVVVTSRSLAKTEAYVPWTSQIMQMAYGSNYSVALRKEGTVIGWGSNDHGQLGAGDINSTIRQSNPVEMKTAAGPLTQVTDIAAYHDVTYALRADGTVWTAGNSSKGGGLATQMEGVTDIIGFSMPQGELLFQKPGKIFYRIDGTVYQKSANPVLYQASETALLSSATSVSQVPDSWQLQYFGHTGIDANALAPNGSGKTILDCYLEGIDPSEAAPKEPLTLSLSTEGPFEYPANVVIVSKVTHSPAVSVTKINFYCNGQELTTGTGDFFQISMTDCSVGKYVITAVAYDSDGNEATATATVEVEPSNVYVRKGGADPNYFSSIIALDGVQGIALDFIRDFSDIFGTEYPWFLRAASTPSAPCWYINVGVDARGANTSTYQQINYLPSINNNIVGGEPPMVAFGRHSGKGTPLYVNQDYHFGIIPGCINQNALKIDVYEKESFEKGAINVAPVVTQVYELPPFSEDFDAIAMKGNFIQHYRLSTNVNGKQVDFETQFEYQTGSANVNWNNGFTTPFILTHRAANDLFVYKVSVQGYGPALGDPSGLIMMAVMDQGNGSYAKAYNVTYTLDFQKHWPWSSIELNMPHFQGGLLPSAYQGKSIDELIHQAVAVQDNLRDPDQATWTQFTSLNNSPDLKTHPVLDQLASDLQNDPMAMANYVQNEIELTDTIGYNTSGNIDPMSINCQGVTRDAFGTYLEGQGSPIEQCSLLIYLLRRAGVPAAYVFPEYNGTLMFDEQLSKLLHLQLRGTLKVDDSSANIPELIPINYPWVTAYVKGKWIHLFPWIKDTSVTEGKDLWNYFPEGYKTGTEWTKSYLLNDPSIRLLSKHDNPGVLFPLYAQKQLEPYGLGLDDVGMHFINRPHNYTEWDQFPRPWQTPLITSTNLAQNLDAAQNPDLAGTLTNIFDTIDLSIVSNRNGRGTNDPSNPLLKTGSLRFADLHDRRLLLYHQIVPGTDAAPHYNMILSLEPYDSSSATGDTAVHTFMQGTNADPGDLKSSQKISVLLDSTNDDAINYQITCHHHEQLGAANLNYWSQFPGVFENNTIVDTRPLRKGDMAALSLDYGRVSQKMKDFELQKYLSYQQQLQLDSTLATDPEKTTGQLLHLMGKTYYSYVSDFKQKIENLTKTHSVSFRAHGLTKMSPSYGANGPITTTNKGVLDFNLIYPRVDMSFQQGATVGNSTTHLESGDNSHSCIEAMQILTAETSAQEHNIINEFFHQASAISTVRLLDIAQGWTQETGKAEHPGEGISILTSNNYLQKEAESLALYGNNNISNGFIGLWSNLLSFFQKNDIASFPIAIITPKPVTALGQVGLPYTGMGAFTLSLLGDGALITDRMFINNGGYGGATEPFSSSIPDLSCSIIMPTPGGGYSFFQNKIDLTSSPHSSELGGIQNGPSLSNPGWFNYLPSINTPQNFRVLNDGLSAGNQSVTPDKVSCIGLWENAVSQTIGSNSEKNTPLSTTGPQIAIALTAEQNSGNIGKTTCYGKLLNHVMDPVSVVTGEFYINDVDLKLNGPMPLEIRRSYGSQNQADNSFGYGWKLSYFPYLMLSADSTTTPNLIYAAETDGSVIAYRYQADQKNWAPTATDNPDLINGSDGTTLSSPNLFNNRITQTMASDGTAIYALKGSDGSTRTFKTKSFPVIGDSSLTRTRPYLDTWRDANGNSYSFNYGANNMAADWGQLNLIQSSNGTNLHLNYDPYGHITEIFSSDGRHLKYNYDGYGDLSSVTRPDGSKESYSYDHQSAPAASGAAATTYSTHLITKEIKPEGRILKNQYDANRRVIAQSSTTGSSPKPIQSATFNYATTTNADNTISGTTTVTDVNGNPTSYTLSSSQIAQISYPNNTSISQKWDPVSRSLTSRTDRRGLVTAFSYDAQGNLTSRSISGNLTGKGSTETAITSMSYNALNALTGVTDPLGNKTSYSYSDTAHPYEPTSITQTIDNSKTTLTYGAYGLLTSQVTAANNSATSETDYGYNKQGNLSSMTQKTGTSDADLTLQFTSNNRGEIVSSTDQSGAKTTFDYDAMGRRTSKEVFDPNGSLIDWHFTYYNENGDVEWEQGARFNPVDKTYYDYDWAGRLHHKMTWLSIASGGSGVADGGQATTTYDHDNYGNITQLTDANGHVTTMTYDQVGSMLTRTSADGAASETFTYEPGGQLATHQTVLGGTESNSYTSTGLLQSATHADGTTTSYVYDLLGRVVQETFPSGLTCNISYNDASGTLTRSYSDGASETEVHDIRGNIVAFTDRAGNKFTSSFDALGRIKNVTGPASERATQSALHVYDPKKNCESIVNGLNETTNIFRDALGRPTLTTIFNSDGSVAKNTSYWYSGDHQSSTIYEGTGSNAIATTIFTDLQNRPLIVQHADGSAQITGYDAMGNKTSFTDEGGLTTTWSYDALNHLASETRPGGATINYSCNAAGELLTRTMPAGLTEKNSYNEAGQKTSDELDGSDGSVTRNHGYSYANGQVTAITDPRGFTTAINYDAFGRPLKITSSGAAVPEQNQTTAYQYDPRGLLTSVAQNYADSSTGPQTKVTRGYDAYGQLLNETTSLNGTNVSAWTQAWNGAGRRTGLTWTLDHQGPQYSFSYNALGLMTSASNASGNCSYSYADNGLLLQCLTPLTTTIINYNRGGEIINRTISEKNEIILSENMGWRSDSRIDNYNVLENVLGMPQEARNYGYDVQGRLTREPYLLSFSSNTNILANSTQTALYSFDQVVLSNASTASNSLGVRTSQLVNNTVGNSVATENSFAQVTSDIIQNTSNTTWQTSYDSAGEVTNRSADKGISQTLTWDAFGRLINVDQSNSSGAGFHWKTIYDGLGRRIKTSYSDANQYTTAPVSLSYYSDPEVEFLELGHDYFGRIWNLYGPDRSGVYGAAQGIGGLETTMSQASGAVNWSINNAFGDQLAILTAAGPYPYGCVLGGYGAMPGSSVNADLVPQWRGHYLDWTGFYYMGTRYYEPNSGRFLSADPLGHDASLSLYDYCNGDPVNGLDPDGRCVEKARDAGYLDKTQYNNAIYMANTIQDRSPNLSTTFRSLAGIGLSYMDDDLSDPNIHSQSSLSHSGVYTMSGMLTSTDGAHDIANRVALSMELNNEDVAYINNNTHGLLKDIERVIGEQFGIIDIRSMMTADTMNASNGGMIIAHSNASAVIGNARPYMYDSAAANINYIGINPQWHIDAAQYGFKSAINIKNINDGVPDLSPGNWFKKWDMLIDLHSVNPLYNHSFKPNYSVLTGLAP